MTIIRLFWTTMSAPSSDAVASSVSPPLFPKEHLVPRSETNALQFVSDYPESNGNAVIVGILDTGVDPAADGLQFLPDGSTPKLINIVDCTGSGDVDVSATAKLAKDEESGHFQVTGLSGRTLTLSKDLTIRPFPKASASSSKDGSKKESKDTDESTDGLQVRLGVKRAYDLFPSRLETRVQAERAKAARAKRMEAYLVPASRALQEYQKPKKPEDVKQRDELQARIDILQDDALVDDAAGPLLDCVVFYDGTHYRAIIISTEIPENDEAMLAIQPLASFAVERQYGTVGVLDQFNFGVQFYQDGTVLSIVSDASPHGTHVAGICAHATDGVAPGAQVVSLKIGDSRLGSMETGTSLTRAMIEAVRHGCNVINLSYGEGTALANHGRFAALADELVQKHNIVFVSSAGNNGPAISTVGAPGGTSSACIGVAAYVSPEMMKAEYSMLPQNNDAAETEASSQPYVGTTYTWSSTGPTADGDFGVDVTAPGGAITSVSNWCLQKSMLMNGTSMSSPHATGCVALLLSACKAQGIPTTPARIKRALMNSCKNLSHLSTLQQGWGMIQVDRALQYLQDCRDDDNQDVYLDVQIDSISGAPRGIYLRQHAETLARRSFTVSVDPTFRPEDEVTAEAQKAKIDFAMHFSLEATADWVSTPDHFMLYNNGRSFKIKIDPTKVPPGVHTARVCGYDTDRANSKIAFSVPITVVKTLPEARDIALGKLTFQPAECKRFFVQPPLGATWMDITIRDARETTEDASTKMMVLHTVQLLPHAAYRDFEVQKYYHLRPKQTVVASIAVEAGHTCEIALARYWSTMGSTVGIDVDVQFRGIRPVPDELILPCGGGTQALVRINSDLADETVSPSGKLTKWLTPVRPKADAAISPLGPRDTFPSRNREVHQLVLTYEFTQEEKGSFKPRAFALQDVLYESAFESQLMMIFDGEKKYLGSIDAFASSITAPKGSVTIRLQVRHDDPEKLEKLKDLVVWIERSLEKDIVLPAFASREAAMVTTSTFRKRILAQGKSASVFFAEPPASKIPSSCKPGDILNGTVSFGSGESSLPGSGKRPGGFPVRYVVGPKPEKAASDPEPEAKDERTPEEKMNDAVRDLKVEHLGKLSSKEEDKFDDMYKKMVAEYPDHLPLLLAKVKHLDGHKKRSDKLDEIVEACEAVVRQISQDEVALHFGRKSDPEDPAAIKERSDMKDVKSTLIEALARLALAQADKKTDEGKTKFQETLQKLKAWVDIDSSTKYAPLVFEREEQNGRYGTAIKLANKLLSKEVKEKDFIKPMGKSDILEKRTALLEMLGYNVLVENDKRNRVLSCPKSYALF